MVVRVVLGLLGMMVIISFKMVKKNKVNVLIDKEVLIVGIKRNGVEEVDCKEHFDIIVNVVNKVKIVNLLVDYYIKIVINALIFLDF